MDVTLRPVQDDDLPLIFAWQSDDVAVALAGVPSRDRPAFDAHWAKIRVEPANTLRTVIAGDAVVGAVMCFPRDGQQELGYWVAREHWGRGVATAAVAAFLEDYRARPLGALVSPGNAASLRVLAKLGFVELSRNDDVVRLRLD